MCPRNWCICVDIVCCKILTFPGEIINEPDKISSHHVHTKKVKMSDLNCFIIRYNIQILMIIACYELFRIMSNSKFRHINKIIL